MRFAHYQCLKIWLNLKLTIEKHAYLVSYYLKSLECEICKTSYPGKNPGEDR